ncbi:MAG: head GIN domain-containing protein [Pyrinomonadaceae bacterium]
MKKFGFLIFLCVLAVGFIAATASSFGKIDTGNFFHFSFGGVKGSGNVITQDRSLSGFHAIEVSNSIQVDVTAQKDFGVAVETDDNIQPLIRTEVSGGVLRISCDKHISTSSPIRVRVSAPDIDKLEVSGASTVALADIKNAAVSIDLSGASRVRLDGETSQLKADASGASKIDAQNLTAENGTISTSGASGANVNVTGLLKADASGASHINYSGAPKDVQKKTSGASSVSGQ